MGKKSKKKALNRFNRQRWVDAPIAINTIFTVFGRLS